MMLHKPNLAQLIYVAERLTDDEAREHEALGFGDYDPEEMAMRCNTQRGNAYVFLDKAGLPYYAVGFTLANPGVAIAWSLSTDDCAKHIMDMTRGVKKLIKGVLQGGVHRVQMSCLESRTAARRWFKALGAQHEATLRMMGRNGESVVVYSITKDSRQCAVS